MASVGRRWRVEGTTRRWLVALSAAILLSTAAPAAGPAAAATIASAATKDAYVRSSSPTRNYGTATDLRVRSGSPAYSSYLGFTVGPLSGPLLSAKLRLWVTDGSRTGGAVYLVSDAWSETTITYGNRPALPATPVATFGTVTAGTWAELDVTAAIAGSGPVSLAVVGTGTNSAFYASRESANVPQLVLTVEDGPPLPPVASFSATPTDGFAPLTVQFTDTSSNSPTTWAWDFQADGVVDSTARNPTFTYASAGVYDVRLQVTNGGGSDTQTALGFVQVDPAPPPPAAAFTAAPTSGTAPLTVSFTDASSGQVTSWAWDFQDDGVIDSTAQDPSFTYTSAGSFTTRLTVSGPGGSSATTGPGPVVVDPSGGGGAPVVLTFTPTADARVREGNPTGNYGTDTVLRARGASTDDYRSYLRFDVTGASGSVTKATLRLWVTDGSPQGGIAWTTSNSWTETGITWANMPALGAAPLGAAGASVAGTWSEIDVTDAVTGDGTVSIAVTSDDSNSVLWTSREGSSPPQLVVEAGSGTPTPPTAAFVGTPTSGSAPLAVQFTDASTGGATAWAWDFQGDGTTDSTARNPSFTYQASGTYTVSLTASNSTGSDTETKAAYIVVSEAPPPGTEEQTVLAAGDIASCSSNGDEATAAVLAQQAGTVVALGDTVYETGTPTEFANCYDPSWGAAKARTHPVVGNHEYGTPGASGYFSYFGAAAGDPAKGWYSFDRAGWHVVVLNSNCSEIGGCGTGSAQEQWLRADLAAHPAQCTLAAWHHPRFSSATTTGTTSVQALWQALYDGGAEIVLAGHAHVYERFAPQTATGVLDLARGIRQFTVGTGGKSLSSFGSTLPNSEVRSNESFGVLRLTLGSGTYSWSFLPVAGETFTDSGTANCH